MPTLSRTPTSSTAVAGRASVEASGSQVWTRPHRGLDGKGDEEGEEHPALRLHGTADIADEFLDQEAVGATGAVDVEGDDADEHDQATGEAEGMNFIAAYWRRGPPNRPMRKYTGMSMASKT